MPRMIMFTGTNLWSLGAKKGASSFYQTIKHYAEHGYEIDLISCSHTDGLDIPGVHRYYFNLEKLMRLGGIPKIGYFFRVLAWLTFQIYVICIGLYFVRHRNPALIYAYEIAGAPAAVLLGKIARLPVVTRFQGTTMKPLIGTWFWRLRFWDHWFALRAHANLVIMANDGTQGDEVLNTLGVPKQVVRFWMNGVEISPIQDTQHELNTLRQNLGCSLDTNILLTVSRLVNWKRLDRIISAIPEIVRAVPDTRLIIVGDGAARQEYEQLANSLNISNFVVFVGAIPHAEVINYIAMATLFVSLYDLSNVGNPLLEAMSCGKCVITLNNGGTSSVVSNENTGILIDLNNMMSLPSIIIDLLNDDQRRVRIGASAKDFARANFLTWTQRMSVELSETKQLCAHWNY